MAFDLLCEESFRELRDWIGDVHKYEGKQGTPMVIVGNKIDLVHEGQEREVSKMEASNFASLESLNYYETSAKTGEGI